ncbi:MAG: hypothetical protein ACOCTP_02745 [Roseicyclus sp.]
MPLWAALCDEPGNPKQMERERIPVLKLFRHALTWRLYDKALLIAVAYPILLPVLQWLVTGEVARIGSFEFLRAAPFWWDRASVLGALTVLILGEVARRWAPIGRHPMTLRIADSLPSLSAAVALVAVGTISIEGTLFATFAAVFAAICLPVAWYAFAGQAAAGGAAAFAIALAASAGVPVTALIAFAAASAFSALVIWMDQLGRSHVGRWIIF